MTINNRPIPPIRQVQNEQYIKKSTPIQSNVSQSFSNILQGKLQNQEQLKFSKHASMRLDSRQIQLSTEQLERLEAGVEKAQAKGIKESLVLMDNVALVVNVANKTVVTAMDQSEAREHVFTNIDGAVVI